MTPDHLLLRSARKVATVLRRVLPVHAYQTRYTAGCLGYWPRPERPRTLNDVEPRLMVEAFLGSDEGQPPDDYKVHLMKGWAHGVTVLTDRFGRFRRAPFDREWRLLPNTVHGIDRMEPPPPRPARLEALLATAERLAAPFPYARVDFYLAADEVVFGEITFFPQIGQVPYVDRRTDLELGSHLWMPAR